MRSQQSLLSSLVVEQLVCKKLVAVRREVYKHWSSIGSRGRRILLDCFYGLGSFVPDLSLFPVTLAFPTLLRSSDRRSQIKCGWTIVRPSAFAQLLESYQILLELLDELHQADTGSRFTMLASLLSSLASVSGPCPVQD